MRVVERALGIGAWSGKAQRLRRHWGIQTRQEDPISALRTALASDESVEDGDNLLVEALDIVANIMDAHDVEPISMSTMHWKQPLVTK